MRHKIWYEFVKRRYEMCRSFLIKIGGALGLCAALLLSACGGGGGASGTPLVPPTSKLRMTPNISGIGLPSGNYAEPTKISGGQPPYYIGSNVQNVSAHLLDDGTVYLSAGCYVAPSSSGGSDSGSGGSSSSTDNTIWVQDSSYNQTTFSFPASILPPPASLYSSLGTTTAITLPPGQMQNLSLTGGMSPYMASSSNPTVASITSHGGSSFTITALAVGTATIAAQDSCGIPYALTVTVATTSSGGGGGGTAPTTPLSVIPATISGYVGSTQTVSILGGTPPYSAISSNTNVATVSVSGSLLMVTLVGATDSASSTILVQDASGSTAIVTATTSLTDVAAIPPAQTVPSPTNSTNTATITLAGSGTGPFYIYPAVNDPNSGLLLPPISISLNPVPGPLIAGSTAAGFAVSLAVPCTVNTYTIPLTVVDTNNTYFQATATVTFKPLNPVSCSSGF
ncbi:MAG: pilus assembly protein N-terminal domain-containing protein [Burkholderiaceae bacterium]|jgi:hypothetical protein|nr:pilus assembly protein N-terminal domain-containing protein [Burkholderiaceae bacterium]